MSALVWTRSRGSIYQDRMDHLAFDGARSFTLVWEGASTVAVYENSLTHLGNAGSISEGKALVESHRKSH